MEPLLTLVIALGGIATGIGAIWTAVVTRHLARATEQSVAEQSQYLREQNERARINLEVDLMYRLAERFNSPRFQNYKIRSLTYVKENYFVDDDILEVHELNLASEQLHDFFDEGDLLRAEVLAHAWGGDYTPKHRRQLPHNVYKARPRCARLPRLSPHRGRCR